MCERVLLGFVHGCARMFVRKAAYGNSCTKCVRACVRTR